SGHVTSRKRHLSGLGIVCSKGNGGCDTQSKCGGYSDCENLCGSRALHDHLLCLSIRTVVRVLDGRPLPDTCLHLVPVEARKQWRRSGEQCLHLYSSAPLR